MKTVYRKVAISERMPPPMTDILIKYRWNDYFEPYHYFDDLHCKDEFLKDVIFWLEEIPDPTTQLKADKAELLEALGISLRLNKAFGANSEWFEVQEIESIIQKHKQ